MIISRTPLRVSFAGGGSDLKAYYQIERGAILSTAIDKYIYITVNKKFDDMIRVSYSQTEMVDSLEKVEHNIIREALRLVGLEKSIEVVYMGDIPLGTAGIGLGSSSSLAVGVLNALYAYKGLHVSAKRLAEEACQIEIEILKHPMGKQDQYIAAYGGFNFIQFNADESVFVDPIIWCKETRERLHKKLMLFYTGIVRMSSIVLTEQQEKTKNNVQTIKKIVKLACELKNNLIENNLNRFGHILHEGWLLKKKLASQITNSQIDDYYDQAMAAGAIGGKILGAGGGGFLLIYCEEEYQEQVRKVLSDLKESPFQFEPQGSKIIYVSD